MGVMGNALGQPPNFKWQAPEKTGVAPFAAPTMTLSPKSLIREACKPPPRQPIVDLILRSIVKQTFSCPLHVAFVKMMAVTSLPALRHVTEPLISRLLALISEESIGHGICARMILLN